MMSDKAIYDLSVSWRLTLEAQSSRNAGANGSNRLLPREQLLADGTKTAAISGNLLKHHHANLLAENLLWDGASLCPACLQRDPRRAGAWAEIEGTGPRGLAEILQCGLCDVHGFLVTAKKGGDGEENRERQSKASLVEFGFGLALPARSHESPQLFSRAAGGNGEGQMLMKVSARSAVYCCNLRYRAVGIGVDTNLWQLRVSDSAERLRRHTAIIATICDSLLSPEGALNARMLPHVSGLNGVIVIRSRAGRAPIYSPLAPDYVQTLTALAARTPGCEAFAFESAVAFNVIMQSLIETSYPCLPRFGEPRSTTAA